jgi:hypothetical protein
VLLVGIAVVVALMRRSSSTPLASTNNQNAAAAGASTAAVTPNANVVPATVQPVVIANDKDRDGLLDAEEQQLGTKDGVADTDGDGLSDYDEVKVYKTNPLKPDTDVDGNTDGAEVEMGYNPNGSGKLLDFEAAKKQFTK